MFSVGERVRIVSGPLIGQKGTVERVFDLWFKDGEDAFDYDVRLDSDSFGLPVPCSASQLVRCEAGERGVRKVYG